MVRTLCLCAALTGLILANRSTADEPKIDEKAAMDALMKAATPGEFHKKLNPLVGEFDFTVKYWMDPSKPPSESKGTSSGKWIMGNRYLLQTAKGDFGGMPFEGAGVTGYDNLQKKYVYSWVDNMGTGIMTAQGSIDESGKVLTFHNEVIDPTINQKVKGKDVTTFVDENTIKTEFFKLSGGKEVKVMEINYKRKK